MDAEQLAAIRERAEKADRFTHRDHHVWVAALAGSQKDIPALLDEIDRLRTDRDDVRGALNDIQALADRWAKYLTDPHLEDHERQVITDLHDELTGIVNEVIDGGDA